MASHCLQAASMIGGDICDRLRVAAELLVAGVAFQDSGTRWNVISHDGDHIGELSTFMVCQMTHRLKKAGLRSTAITDVRTGEQQSVTFGHFYPDGSEMAEIMARRSRRFSTVH